MKSNESINSEQKLSKLYELLENTTVYNWYCGHVTALYAFNHSCYFEHKGDQSKVRRLLKANEYVAHFNGGILSIEC